MRFSIAFLGLLSAVAAPSAALNLFPSSGQSRLSGDTEKVPGNSPLEFCTKERDDDIVQIEKVDLSPNPPQAGEELVIKATGTISEQIDEGAYVFITVKYGLIKLISMRTDLCEQLENVDLTCPLEKGKLSITKVVSLPAEIPPGKYTVLADVFSNDDRHITCLTATVVFSREGFFNLEL